MDNTERPVTHVQLKFWLCQLFFILRGNQRFGPNQGDQFVNLQLRDSIRRAAKLRLMQHALQLHRGELDPESKIAMGEADMKPLVVKWSGQYAFDLFNLNGFCFVSPHRFLGNEKLSSWIVSSWESILRHREVSDDVVQLWPEGREPPQVTPPKNKN